MLLGPHGFGAHGVVISGSGSEIKTMYSILYSVNICEPINVYNVNYQTLENYKYLR